MALITIGFTGTRHGMNWQQKDAVTRELKFWMRGPLEAVHHGCCRGADEDLNEICRALGIHTVGHPGPDGDKWRSDEHADVMLPPKGHFARNRDIVNACAILFAAPAQVEEQRYGGTWYTINYARQRHVARLIFQPDGILIKEGSDSQRLEAPPEIE